MAQLPKANVEADTNGKWFEYAAGIKFRIARAGNPKFQEFLRKQTKRGRRGISSDDLMMEAIANTVLVDWENLTDEEGVEITYSPAQAIEFFKEPAYYEVYKFVLSIAGDDEEWGIEEEAEN